MNTRIEILLVEDNPGDAELIQEILSDDSGARFHFTHTEQLSDAIQHLRQKGAHLVLLDLGLPDSNGLDTIRRVHRAAPDIPIVVLTGNDNEAAGIAAVKAGAQDYLVKGKVSSDLLKRVLSHAVERHQHQESLRKSEQFLRSSLDALTAHIAILDPNGEILEVNRAWRQFVSANHADQTDGFIGANYLTVCESASADAEAAAVAAGIRAVIDGTEDIFETEYPCHSADRRCWFHLRVTAFPDEPPRRVVVAHEDVTKRCNLEDMLRQAQKMESLGTLAGGIAHDFNNILSAIIGFTQMTIDRAAVSDDVKNNLEEVYQAGIRASDLVKQILTFSRRTDMALNPLDIGIVIREALKLLRSTLPTSIEIRQRIEKDLDHVLADPTHIHQIIMNLCTNAAHAMEPAGGVLEINLSPASVGAEPNPPSQTLEPGEYLKLTVSDTGCGMAPEIMASIFDPYFTTKELGEGTGLGLSVVHGIIKEYGGDILVSSTPGKGTLFTLYFPVVRTISADSPQVERRLLPRGTEHILVVDDEPPILKINSHILEELGYRVTTENDSVRALSRFKNNPDSFDLVLSDVTMPKLTGDRLAQKIMAVRADIPVILCSGYTRIVTEQKASSMGVHALIVKPIVKRTLATEIRRILDESDSSKRPQNGGGTD